MTTDERLKRVLAKRPLQFFVCAHAHLRSGTTIASVFRSLALGRVAGGLISGA